MNQVYALLMFRDDINILAKQNFVFMVAFLSELRLWLSLKVRLVSTIIEPKDKYNMSSRTNLLLSNNEVENMR